MPGLQDPDPANWWSTRLCDEMENHPHTIEEDIVSDKEKDGI